MKNIFSSELYNIEDKKEVPFIDREEILSLLKNNQKAPIEEVQRIVDKAVGKVCLTLQEVATLIGADYPEAIEAVKQGAKTLKQNVYGNRIVLFAPLYIGNKCINNCSYCGFKVTAKETIRKTLSPAEMVGEVEALEKVGHKRLILVFGEHPIYDAKYIADCVKNVYSVKTGNGEIRRVNINAAPFDVEGFRIIKESGIGTFQVFQETYDPELYPKYHLAGAKSDFNNRLTSLDRAMEAGIDDVGIGALFGLGDWRFEVMGLVRHTKHLEKAYGVGPHTISFPRITPAKESETALMQPVSDDDLLRLITILRLAVPYTGLILTAREGEKLRRDILQYGVSQIDGGTNINIGGYTEEEHKGDKEQFTINDDRPLNEIIEELIDTDFLPSFCTACYRKGRTGEHFMEFAVPGFIKRFCTPNAILTLAEYLEDYAAADVKRRGYEIIDRHIEKMEEERKQECIARIKQIKNGDRDLLY